MADFISKPPTRYQRFKWSLRGHIPFSNWWILWRKLDKSAKSILDLGCGIGSPVRFINRHKQFHMVGVEGYKPYFDNCQKIGLYDMVLNEDIRKIPYKAKTFDIVMALQVLEHLNKPDGEKLLKDMEKIARKQVIVTTDIGKHVQGAVDGNEMQIHRYIWDIKDLQELGFETYGTGLMGYEGETGYGHILPQFPRWVVATSLQTIIGLFVYHFPRYAGAAVCIKNLEGTNND